jgi:UDP-glucuronate 4-epimerase
MKILITGCAGFIGYSFIKKIASSKYEIYGIDNFTDNYEVSLKLNRLKSLKKYLFEKKCKFHFKNINLTFKKKLENSKFLNKIDVIYNFAALPGIRYSRKYPKKTFNNNVKSFDNILSLAPNTKLIVYASSSNVYSGINTSLPLKENIKIRKQKNSYGKSKRNNELKAEKSKNKNQKLIGLRFFSVYGPWGRPDMAYYKFTKNIILNKPIDLFGDNYRDMTFIDDIVSILSKLLKDFIKGNIDLYFKNSRVNSTVFNIGAGSRVKTSELIKIIEKLNKKKALIVHKPYNDFEMRSTLSNSKKIIKLTKHKRFKKILSGMKIFNSWFRNYK